MVLKSKKAIVNQLTAIAFGIVTLAIIIGVGLTVLVKLSGSVALCPAGYTYQTGYGNMCVNATYGDPTAPHGSAYTGISYAMTQLGSTGLLSWLPAIIALLVGIFFLMYFMGSKKNR